MEHVMKESVNLTRDHWGKLVFVDSSGALHHGVVVIPMFPISDRGNWISIQSADGTELTVIEDPSQYSKEVSSLLYEELAYRDFVPKLEKVLSVSGNEVPCEWSILTNHGETRFVLKAEDDIRRLSPNEVMIIDAQGGRYRVDDMRKLDRRSRRFIEWYV
jgi:hypothetical protein